MAMAMDRNSKQQISPRPAVEGSPSRCQAVIPTSPRCIRGAKVIVLTECGQVIHLKKAFIDSLFWLALTRAHMNTNDPCLGYPQEFRNDLGLIISESNLPPKLISFR